MKLLVFLLIAGLAGFSVFQYQKIDQLDTQVHMLRSSLQEAQAQQKQLQSQLDQEKNQLATDQATLQKQRADQLQRLASARAQAMLEEQRVAALKKNIQSLQMQGKNGNQSIVDAQLKRDQELLKDIENRIKYYDSAQKEVNQNSKESLRLRQSQEKEQLHQIDENIKLQNQQIKQTQQDIKFWQKKKRDPNQADKLAELDSQLQAQQMTLSQLLAQKKEASDELAQNSVSINSEANAEKDELKSTQGQLQSQALNVRSELQRLQDQKNRGQKDGQNVNVQIRALQDQVNASNVKLKSLYDEISTLEKATTP